MKAGNYIMRGIVSLSLIYFMSSLTGCDTQSNEFIAPINSDGPVKELRSLGNEKTTFYYGTPVSLGKGIARTWIESSRSGKPVAIGITISAKAAKIDNLPKEQTMYHLQFPKQGEFAPFMGMMFDWNPHGHIPMELYEKPHFDMHFYMIPEAEHMAIPLGLDYQHADWFERDYMPADYMSLHLAIPGMGNHWIYKNAPELGPEGFSKTLILGAYEDKQIFIEPMITLEYLQQLLPSQTITEEISQFPHVQKSGYYPRRYTITYDPNPGEYKIALTDLYYREAK